MKRTIGAIVLTVTTMGAQHAYASAHLTAKRCTSVPYVRPNGDLVTSARPDASGFFTDWECNPK